MRLTYVLLTFLFAVLIALVVLAATATSQTAPTAQEKRQTLGELRTKVQTARDHRCRAHYQFQYRIRAMPDSWLRGFIRWTRGRVDHERDRSSRCLPTNPRALGKYLAAKLYGWTDANGQWDALDAIILRESAWNRCRHYPSTTNCAYAGPNACGIPQANPCSKLLIWCGAPTIGTCSVRSHIIWTLRYIADRYGSPSVALANGSTY